MISLPHVDEDNKSVIALSSIHFRNIYLLNNIKKLFGNFNNFIFLHLPIRELLVMNRYIPMSKDLVPNETTMNAKRENFLKFVATYQPEHKVILDEIEDYDFPNGDNLIRNHYRYDYYQGILKLFLESERLKVHDEFFKKTHSVISCDINSSIMDHDSYSENYEFHVPLKNYTDEQILELLTDEELEFMNQFENVKNV